MELQTRFLAILFIHIMFALCLNHRYLMQTTPGSNYDFYFTKEELKLLNCEEMAKGNETVIEKYVNNGRIKLISGKLIDLPMDCESISKRIEGNRWNFGKLRRPVAFVRNIFTLYEFQEFLLSMIYHPDNTYCYSVDSKTTNGLFEKIQKLTQCFPNIYLNPGKYDLDSSGHFQNRAQLKCLEIIMNRTWYHTILLQNYDLVLKPAEQLSELSEMLNYTSMVGSDYGFKGRFEEKADWTPAALKLFKNESGVPQDVLHRPLTIRKYLAEVILSKEFVESIFEKLNLEKILDLFDNNKFYGVDEMLIQTLYLNQLGLNGEMSSNCTEVEQVEMIRKTEWMENDIQFDKNCKSKFKRHLICIIGVEYLRDFANSETVIANKVMENFDFGPMICLKEMFRNGKTKAIPERALLPFSNYREMLLKQNETYNKETFQC